MSADPRYVSRSEYARLRKCSPSYITKLGDQGRLVLTADRRIDVAATNALLDATNDPGRGGDRSAGPLQPGAEAQATPASPHQSVPGSAPQAAPGNDAAPVADINTPAYKNAATRERLAKAQIAELELAEKAGSLVRRAEVEAAIFSLARQAMDAMDAIADRLATQLAAEADPNRVHALLSEEIHRIAQALAKARPTPELPATSPPDVVQEVA